MFAVAVVTAAYWAADGIGGFDSVAQRDKDGHGAVNLLDGEAGLSVQIKAKSPNDPRHFDMESTASSGSNADPQEFDESDAAAIPPQPAQDLSYEERQAIQTVAYDTINNTGFSSIGLIDSIECTAQQCDLTLAMFNAQESGKNSSEIMARLNDELLAESNTENVQVFLKSIRPDGQGGATLSLVAGARRNPSHEIEFRTDNGQVIGILSERINKEDRN